MTHVMLAEPSTIALFGAGFLILTLLAIVVLVCILAIRAKRLGGTVFDFAFGKMLEKKDPAPPVVPPTQPGSRKCPQCGAELKPDVPEGLCPACLLQRGIATEGGAPPGTPPFVPPTIPDLAKLFPQLEILELIGKGGMGAVYKARQPALDRLVALKILASRSSSDAGFAERFTREARALARLSHPNIVAVYDFGQTNGLSYFLMEYVDGPNLRQIEQAGRLSPREALEIIPQICSALQFAHDECIVHRDIKPENVLLDKKGRVKIADFGLAKILGQETQDFRLTGARDIMGTPHYMAPEQVEKPQDVDHRADIYSLGVVFYEMLTGELPLGKFQPPSQKVQMDVRLDAVVLRSLAKEPELRYQQVSQVKTAVETISGSAAAPGAPIGAPPVMAATAALTQHPDRFWRRFAVVMACVVLIPVAIAILGILAAIAIPNFVKGRNQALAHRQQPAVAVQQTDLVSNLAFGPVIERVVSGEGDANKRFIDFDTGKLFAASEFFGAKVEPSPEETRHWQQRTGIDAVGDTSPAIRGLVGFDLVAVPVVSTEWANARPDGLGYWLEMGRAGTPAVMSGKGELPQTYIVKTREGRTGILQITGFTDNPRGVKIRYKLAQAAAVAKEQILREPDAPPVVIGTFPESGAANVDPALTELRASFSKPMQDGSHGWVMWSKDYPETMGLARYLPDGRTSVLPVRLKPATVYAIWLNSESTRSFRDRDGQPAVPYLLIFETRK